MAGKHHRGTFSRYSQQLRDTANRNPRAVCWRDGLTLDQHPPHHDGSRPTWTAGHTIAGDPNALPWLDVTRTPPPGSWLAPEASTCNYSAGARHVNKLRANPQSRAWFT